MTENRPRRDTAIQSIAEDVERKETDPLPWLIRSLRQKHQELSEGSRVQDPREQTP